MRRRCCCSVSAAASWSRGYFPKKGVGKLSDFAKEMESNPDAAAVRAAELVLRLNPDVDVLSSDPAAGTITVREKKTGKEVTFDLEDIKAGKFSITDRRRDDEHRHRRHAERTADR